MSGAHRVRRLGAAAGAVLLLVVGIVALARSREDRPLDPRSYGPRGAHALAVLLARRGATTAVVTDPGELHPGPDLAVLVPAPEDLGSQTVAGLRRAQARVVLVAAEQAQLDAAGLAVTTTAEDRAEVRDPACADPLALRAGGAVAGGTGYAVRRGGAGTGCYASGAGAHLVLLDGGRTVLLGSPAALENQALDRAGDASLALQLLEAPRVAWLVPPAPPVASGAQRRGFLDLLPGGVVECALLLGLAVALLALARGRRWGRVVVEPLPVTVPAAEVVEGTGRLYAAARARGTAAAALRAATRARLATALRLPVDAAPESLAEAVARRSARTPAAAAALLYGPEPPDDRALVALAGALDDIEAEVRQP